MLLYNSSVHKTSKTQYLGAVWAVTGLTIVVIDAFIRLVPHALDALRSNLSLFEWAIFIIICGFILLTEGYRGFQKQFSPRFAARALYLLNNPRPIHVLLAPIFCIGFIHASKRRKITAWSLTIGIIILIVIVRQLAQPWRGMVDAAVILGLSYGLATVYYFTWRAITTMTCTVDPEVE